MPRTGAHFPHPPRRMARTRARALISDLAIGVLSFFVLLCVGLATPAVWTAVVESTHPKPRACDTIKDPSERLACATAARAAHANAP